MASRKPQALERFRVLDLSGPPGQPCGRILGDWGADVIKVEPPGGDPARLLAPFAGGSPHIEKGVFFLQNNTNKRSVVLEITTPGGQETLRRLVQTADVVLESSPVGYLSSLQLGYEELAALNPRLVMTSITPFGQTGPYAGFKGADIAAVATSGLLYLNGEPGERPYTMPRYQAWQTAGVHAAFGTLLGLYHSLRTGWGQQVDVSLQEVLAHQMFTISAYDIVQQVQMRSGQSSVNPPNTFFPCKNDQWVNISVYQAHEWKPLADWMGDPELSRPEYLEVPYRQSQGDLIDALVAAFTSQFDREEFLKEAARRRIPAASLNTIQDFMDHPHTRERQWMVEVEHPIVGRYWAPGPPIRASATPWRISMPAPLLGQHTEEVLREIAHPDRLASGRQTRPSPASKTDSLPLEGVRIADFARVWAGAFGTRHLADFGASAIKVESTKFPDFRETNPKAERTVWLLSNARYAEINRNKLSVTVDMHFEEGRDLARHLVRVSDVATENYAARTMERFGLGYEDLRQVKPDIIMVRCPAFGLSGPMRDVTGYGGSVCAFAGMSYLWGFPDAELATRSKQVHPDYVTAINLALATMIALLHKEATGEGQLMEVAQHEAAAATIGQAFLEQHLCPKAPTAWGNRDPNFAPQGVYRCLGEDRWCAISCQTDDDWRALASLMGEPSWTTDPRFATAAARWEHHDMLDARIEAWTATLTPHQAMLKCQAAGIAAGVVATGEDLYRDPHLRTRGYIVEIDHPIPCRVSNPGMTVRLTRTPGRVQRPAPLTGQHNQEVLQGVLGLSQEDQQSLAKTGVLA